MITITCENETKDYAIYLIEAYTPPFSKDYRLCIDFIENLVSCSVVAYGSGYEMNEQEARKMYDELVSKGLIKDR